MNEGTLLLNKQDSGLNEQQILTFGGTASGSVQLSFNGVNATAVNGLASPLLVTDEVQTFSLAGTAGGTFLFNYNGVAAQNPLVSQAGLQPAASQVQQALFTIPALKNNVNVQGPNGGPFTITYNGALAGQNIANPGSAQGLTLSSTTGVTLSNPLTSVQGNALTALQIQTNLNSIPALNGNVTVTATTVNGTPSSPYTISFSGVLAGANVPQIVATPSATMIASDPYPGTTVLTTTDGTPGTPRGILANAIGTGPVVGRAQMSPTLADEQIGGQVFIGNDAGGDNADKLIYGNTAGNDQIYSLTGVTVASSGLLESEQPQRHDR